ncbi:MAG: alpha/beta hydrolase [Acidimicrobiales bacterium]
MTDATPASPVAVADHRHDGLSWRESGKGPPVIFLHGLGGTRSAWGSQLRGLADQFRCIAWDMPGYGDAAPLTPLTYRGIAQRVVDLIDAVGAERADLVGLSFGGMQALHTAINFPQRVGRLVLADTSPAFGMDGTTKEDWTRDRLAPLENGGTPADGAERVIDLITGIRLTGEIRAEQIQCFSEISPEGFRSAVECLPTNDIRSQLQSIEHPSLVIVGELDKETPPSYAAVLNDGLPNSRLEILPGVGHLSPAEAPDAFNALVRDFLLTR